MLMPPETAVISTGNHRWTCRQTQRTQRTIAVGLLSHLKTTRRRANRSRCRHRLKAVQASGHQFSRRLLAGRIDSQHHSLPPGIKNHFLTTTSQHCIGRLKKAVERGRLQEKIQSLLDSATKTWICTGCHILRREGRFKIIIITASLIL